LTYNHDWETIAVTLVRILTTKQRAGKWAVKHKQGRVAYLVPNQYINYSFFLYTQNASKLENAQAASSLLENKSLMSLNVLTFANQVVF
jgi:hypothetical protein